MIQIRRATLKDFNKTYYLADRIPELKVSDKEPFMDKQEFMFAMKNPDGVFLIAEENGKIVGFTYSSIKIRGKEKIACFVYLAVHPKYRKKGIGTILWDERLKRLRKRKVVRVYEWISASNKRMQRFSEKHGKLKPGKKFIWFDRKL
ncbi:MAG: GNAT family N-acetyltransferase [Candidatus Micrarchaeota archaeon]